MANPLDPLTRFFEKKKNKSQNEEEYDVRFNVMQRRLLQEYQEQTDNQNYSMFTQQSHQQTQQAFNQTESNQSSFVSPPMTPTYNATDDVADSGGLMSLQKMSSMKTI